MKQSTIPPTARTRRDRIREIGFDPAYLTDREQEELLELHERVEPMRAPDELEPLAPDGL